MRSWPVALCVALVSCGEPTSGPSATDPPRYLPVGARVAEREALPALPEPFDPRRHRLVANTRIARNLAGEPGFVGPPRRRKSPDPTAAQVVTTGVGGDIGLSLWQWTRHWYGVYAAHDAGLSVQLPARSAAQPASYLFAPTLLPPGWSCLETTTVHERRAGSSTTGHYQGWFDWCQSGPQGRWVVFEPMDQDFRSRYVRTWQGRSTIALAIVTASTGSTYGHCWFGTMYDYVQGGWVQVTQSCTTGAGFSPAAQGGWVYWESHNLLDGSCPAIADIAAIDLMFADPAINSWIPVTSTPPGNVNPSGGGACWSVYGGPYTFSWPGTSAGLPANAWLAKTTFAPPRRR